MSKPLPAAVLWDMDGTLIDSEPFWLLSEANLAKQYGHTWTQENGHELIGKSLYDSSAILLDRFKIKDLSVEDVIANLTDSVVSHLRESLPWRPGALELLMDLRKHGVKTALVTMSMRRMAIAVAEKIPFQAFDIVIAGDDVVRGKPDPEPYLKAAKALGVDPKDCVALEDSNTGLNSAEAAGTFAIGIPNIVPIPNKPGRRLVASLTELTAASLREMMSHE